MAFIHFKNEADAKQQHASAQGKTFKERQLVVLFARATKRKAEKQTGTQFVSFFLCESFDIQIKKQKELKRVNWLRKL